MQHGVNKRGLEPGWPSQGLRVKRAIIGGRRGCPSTPVPSWKLLNNQLFDGIAAAAAAHAAAGRPTPVSARKLAASLWELQEHPLPACLCSQHWLTKGISDMSSPRSQADSYFSPRSCKFAYQQYVKTGADNGKRSGNFSKHLAAAHSHVHHGEKGDGLDKLASASIQLDGQRLHQHSPAYSTRSSHRKCDGKLMAETLTTSSELLKVLSRIRILEEQHNSSLGLTAKLQTELDQARARVQDLEQSQKSDRREMESIMKKMSEEKASWKAKEQEKMQEMVSANMQALKDELEEERKVRRRLEIVNRKMTKELVEANMTAAKALEELEKERKARQLMEDVCDELAHEIGDDKQEREELKRESERVRDELEEERRMLQLAEVWREERVQMKLCEAKVALEEKSAALDVMRAELESFLRGDLSNGAAVQEAEVLRNVITAMHPRGLVASFPPIALNQAASPDHDLYTMDMSNDETGEGQYWGNPLDSQEIGRWEGDSEGDVIEDHREAHLARMNSSQDAKESVESGSDYVSESHESDEEDDLHDCEEGDRDNSHWEGQHKNGNHYHANGNTVHAQDPEDSVDEYAHTDEDIVALNRPNGHHVEKGVWREEAYVEDDQSSQRLSNGHAPQVLPESSPQQKSQQQSLDKANNTHIIRGMKGHMEWPKSNIDMVMRSKLFESNLERQQLIRNR